MRFTHFRRSRRRGVKLHRKKSPFSLNDSKMPSNITESTMGKTKASKRVQVERSSGNVFADLGLPHPEEHLVKFTIDRLMRYLRKLDYDVTIRFQPKPKSRGEATIHVEGVALSA